MIPIHRRRHIPCFALCPGCPFCWVKTDIDRLPLKGGVTTAQTAGANPDHAIFATQEGGMRKGSAAQVRRSKNTRKSLKDWRARQDSNLRPAD